MQPHKHIVKKSTLTLVKKSLQYGLITMLIGINSVTALVASPIQMSASASAPSGGKWEQVSAGGGFTCGLFQAEVYCWGLNENGQLGNGTTTNTTKPGKVEGLLVGKNVTTLEAADGHVCVIANGELFCWGDNDRGQLGIGTTSDSLVPVAVSTSGALSGVTPEKLITSEYNTCVVGTNSNAYCWGQNYSGQFGINSTANFNVPVEVATSGAIVGKDIVDVGMGWDTLCFLASDKTVYCSGYNGEGELGDGTTNDSDVTVSVDMNGVLSGKTIKSMIVGGEYTCVLSIDSNVYCWGANYSGMLGDGSTTDSSVPVAVSESGTIAGKTINLIEGGTEEICVVTDDGIYCWGSNYTGQLGTGTLDNKLSPTKVDQSTGLTSGTDVRQLSIGYWYNSGVHSCALTNTGLYCWGSNRESVLGREDIGVTNSLKPIPFADAAKQALGGETFSTLSTSRYNTCGIATDSKAYCWGANFSGSLGDGSTSPSYIPVAVSTTGVLAGKTITKLHVGAFTTCAIASDNLGYCWGSNDSGQLGNGNTADSSVPVAVSMSGALAGKTLKDINTNVGVTCAVASDDNAYCWGANYFGTLGNGNNTDSSVPVAVSTAGVLAGKTIKSVYVSDSYHACVIASDDKAYCWGQNNTYYNSGGQLGNGNRTNSNVPVAVSTAGVLAGKTLTKLALGRYASCGLVADGSVYCWGDNEYNQLGNGATGSYSAVPSAVVSSGVLTGKTVTSISTSNTNSCVRTSDAKLYCWGNNFGNGLGDGTTDDSNVPVAVAIDGAVQNQTVQSLSEDGVGCAIYSNNNVYCWGNNDYTQLANPIVDYTPSPLLYDYTLPDINNLSDQMSTPLTKRPTFTGVAEPGSTIVVTVHSDPVTCTTTADSNGNWSCTLPSDLPAGQHTVNVVVTTPTNNVINLGPYTVTVSAGSILSGNLNSPDTGGGSTFSWGVISIGTLVILLAVVLLVPKRNRKTI